jgi:hypothetical protein
MAYINPAGSGGTPVGRPKGASAGKGRPEIPECAAAAPFSHLPAPGLAQYEHLLHDLPEVREERLREVARRLQSGYYLSEEAAEATARLLLDRSDASL